MVYYPSCKGSGERRRWSQPTVLGSVAVVELQGSRGASRRIRAGGCRCVPCTKRIFWCRREKVHVRVDRLIRFGFLITRSRTT